MAGCQGLPGLELGRLGPGGSLFKPRKGPGVLEAPHSWGPLEALGLGLPLCGNDSLDWRFLEAPKNGISGQG